MPVLAHWKRFRIGEIAVEHHARRFGYSKFGGGRFFRGLMDLLTVVFLLRYGRRPAHFFGAFGTITLAIGLAIFSYLCVIWFMGHDRSSPTVDLGRADDRGRRANLATGLIAELIVHMNRNDMPFLVRRTLENQNAAAALPPVRESGLGPLESRNPIGARRLD